jgi:mRNA-degrading endonuclease RelE of RelBE toxin-antitoxin system
MNFETIEHFDKQAKKLSKKYKNIKKDLQSFIQNFDTLHQQAISIKSNLFKIRLANSNKNRGKSAGYRIYYYIQLEETTYLVTIYDKSEITMIDEDMLVEIIERELGLNSLN